VKDSTDKSNTRERTNERSPIGAVKMRGRTNHRTAIKFSGSRDTERAGVSGRHARASRQTTTRTHAITAHSTQHTAHGPESVAAAATAAVAPYHSLQLTDGRQRGLTHTRRASGENGELLSFFVDFFFWWVCRLLFGQRRRECAGAAHLKFLLLEIAGDERVAGNVPRVSAVFG